MKTVCPERVFTSWKTIIVDNNKISFDKVIVLIKNGVVKVCLKRSQLLYKTFGEIE